jgi:hypothetical protein
LDILRWLLLFIFFLFFSFPLLSDDKNPDVIPHENSDDEYMLEEKQFDRLNIDRHRNLFAASLNFNNYSPSVLSSTTRLSKQVRKEVVRQMENGSKKYIFLCI